MPHFCVQARHLLGEAHVIPGMIRCSSSASSLLCTLNLLLVGLGLTSIGVICWLEDGSISDSSAVLIAIPCFVILSGIFGCISQCQEGCIRIHIAAVIASMVLLVGGLCVVTLRKNEVVTQLVQSGEFSNVASSVVSWSQILFLLMVCGQACVLLSACLVGCCNLFIQKKAKAREREFARHLRRIIGCCPSRPAKALPGPGQGTIGTMTASMKPHLRVPGYDEIIAAGKLGQQTPCDRSAEELEDFVARRVKLRTLRPWTPFARAIPDVQTQVPFLHPSHVPPLPVSMDIIMEEVQHTVRGQNANQSEIGLANEEEVELEYEDAENPDTAEPESSSSSPSPSLHSAKSELITDIQEATRKMRSRMPDPDFFAPKNAEITETELSSDD